MDLFKKIPVSKAHRQRMRLFKVEKFCDQIRTVIGKECKETHRMIQEEARSCHCSEQRNGSEIARRDGGWVLMHVAWRFVRDGGLGDRRAGLSRPEVW